VLSRGARRAPGNSSLTWLTHLSGRTCLSRLPEVSRASHELLGTIIPASAAPATRWPTRAGSRPAGSTPGCGGGNESGLSSEEPEGMDTAFPGSDSWLTWEGCFEFDWLPVIADAVGAFQTILVDQMALLRRIEARIAAPAGSPDRRCLVVTAVAAFSSTHRSPAPGDSRARLRPIGPTERPRRPTHSKAKKAGEWVRSQSSTPGPYDDTVWRRV